MRKAANIVLYVIISLFTVIMIYPFVYAFLGALSTPEAFAHSGLFPDFRAFNFANFLEILYAENFVASLFLTLGRTVYYCIFTVFTSVLLGYVFAKMQFKGKKIIFMYFMSSMMVPGVATIIPTYILFARFPLVGGNNIIGLGGHGFINEWPVMFITGLFGIFNVFLVRQSIVEIGDEYKEAAENDGANLIQIIFKVYLPMLVPILTYLLIGLVLGQWNDYFFNMMYAYSDEVLKPLGYYVTEIISQYNSYDTLYQNSPAILGVAFMFMLPPMIFFMVFQDNFVKNFSIGGIKG